MNSREEAYHALLMEYASGCLDEAHSLVIAAHMALSPAARKIVSGYESIGGSMLNMCCTPVAMNRGARDSVLARLDAIGSTVCSSQKKKASDNKNPCVQNSRQGDHSEKLSIPVCLERYITTMDWTQDTNGSRTITVRTTCTGSRAQLMKIDAGRRVDRHTHRTSEVTLVLEGGFSDGAQRYRRGDLFILEKQTPHSLQADDREGCMCIVVRPSPLSARTVMNQILRYFRNGA